MVLGGQGPDEHSFGPAAFSSPAVGVPVRKFGDAPELADRAGVGQEIEVGSDENPNDLLEARSLGEAGPNGGLIASILSFEECPEQRHASAEVLVDELRSDACQLGDPFDGAGADPVAFDRGLGDVEQLGLAIIGGEAPTFGHNQDRSG